MFGLQRTWIADETVAMGRLGRIVRRSRRDRVNAEERRRAVRENEGRQGEN